MAIKWAYSTACVRTSLSTKSLKDGRIFWGGTGIYSCLLLVIPGGRIVTLMDPSMVCSCCVASQTGSLSLSFDSGLSLCLGSWSSWLMEEANLGGAANVFHFLRWSCTGFFLFFCHGLLGYFWENYLNLFTVKLSALWNTVKTELLKVALLICNHKVFGSPCVWTIICMWNMVV